MDSLLIEQRRKDATRLLAIDAGAVVDSYAERSDRELNSLTHTMLAIAVHHAIGEIAKGLMVCEDFAYPDTSALAYRLTWAMDDILITSDMASKFMSMYGCDFDTARDAERVAHSAIADGYIPLLRDLANDLSSAILNAMTDEPGGTD